MCLAPVDEKNEGGDESCSSSIHCPMDGEGAMLGCGGSLRANDGIWERRGQINGVSQRFDVTTCVVSAVLLLKRNLCHSKLPWHFFTCVCIADFSRWKGACLSSNNQVIFVMALFLMLWIS